MILNLLISIILFSNLGKAFDFVLALGNSTKIKTQSRKIWIQKKGILNVSAQGSYLIFAGIKTGKTLVRFNEQVHQITVVEPQNAERYKFFQRILKSKVGLNLSTQGKEITITGRLFKLSDWRELASDINQDINYVFSAEMNSDLQNLAKNYFNFLFQKNGLSPLNLRFGKRVELIISNSDEKIEKYRELLNPYGIQVIKDKDAIKVAPLVKIMITVAEVNRTFSQKIGILPNSNMEAQLLPKFESKDWNAQINFIESSGQGRILASPNILCKSGKEAEFLAGGEIPIKVSSKLSSSINWKRYGVFLKVKPKADYEGRISLSITSEVSSLDMSTGNNDIPGILTNKVSSHFDLIESQTIALSGLLNEVHGNSKDGLAFLSQLPILGSLFSSNNFLNKKTELIVFVRPELSNPLENKRILSEPFHLKEKIYD